MAKTGTIENAVDHNSVMDGAIPMAAAMLLDQHGLRFHRSAEGGHPMVVYKNTIGHPIGAVKQASFDVWLSPEVAEFALANCEYTNDHSGRYSTHRYYAAGLRCVRITFGPIGEHGRVQRGRRHPIARVLNSMTTLVGATVAYWEGQTVISTPIVTL